MSARGECLLPTKVTYSHTGFYNGQGSYFNMKVHVSAEPGRMQFISTTSNPKVRLVPSVNKQHYPWVAGLEPCTKNKVCTPFTSYTFLVADNWSSTAVYTELYYTSHFDSLLMCALSYWLATLQHIPCVQCNSVSVEYRPDLTFLAPTQLRWRQQ